MLCSESGNIPIFGDDLSKKIKEIEDYERVGKELECGTIGSKGPIDLIMVKIRP